MKLPRKHIIISRLGQLTLVLTSGLVTSPLIAEEVRSIVVDTSPVADAASASELLAKLADSKAKVEEAAKSAKAVPKSPAERQVYTEFSSIFEKIEAAEDKIDKLANPHDAKSKLGALYQDLLRLKREVGPDGRLHMLIGDSLDAVAAMKSDVQHTQVGDKVAKDLLEECVQLEARLNKTKSVSDSFPESIDEVLTLIDEKRDEITLLIRMQTLREVTIDIETIVSEVSTKLNELKDNVSYEKVTLP